LRERTTDEKGATTACSLADDDPQRLSMDSWEVYLVVILCVLGIKLFIIFGLVIYSRRQRRVRARQQAMEAARARQVASYVAASMAQGGDSRETEVRPSGWFDVPLDEDLPPAYEVVVNVKQELKP